MMYIILLLLALFGAALSQTSLSAADKQTILNEHNRLRGMVSPTAANMLRMVSLGGWYKIRVQCLLDHIHLKIIMKLRVIANSICM